MEDGEAKNSLVGEDGVIHVRFDQARGTNYAMCNACLFCSTVSACALVPFFPCVLYWGVQEFEAQECTVDDRRIHYRGGWINKKEKTVPLDRVQDLEIQEGCFQRCYGVSSVLVQTAGANNPNVPAEITLYSPVDARNLRAQIIQRRDAIVLNANAPGSSAMGGGVDHVATQPRGTASSDMTMMVNELRALRESVNRIEKTVELAAANVRQ